MKRIVLIILAITSLSAQDDIFINHLPKLTKEQIDIYRKTWPIIIKYIDNPNNYYASSILKKEDTIRVEISPTYSLRKLKATVCKNDSQAVVLRFNDSRYPRKFLFNRKFELEKCFDSYNKLIDMRECP